VKKTPTTFGFTARIAEAERDSITKFFASFCQKKKRLPFCRQRHP
jgi:hypothetical protein